MQFLAVGRADLRRHVEAQLRFLSPEGRYPGLEKAIGTALERAEHCFSQIVLPGYRLNGHPVFNSSHSDQYAAFLYFVSNTAWKTYGDRELAVDAFRLNKALHGLNCMYDTELPEVFALIHAVGMVLGKASYGNYFVAYQNVTVGTDRGMQPAIGENVILFGGSIVVGASELGDGAVVSANSTIINQRVEAGCVAAGSSPDLTIRPRKRVLRQDYFV